MNRPPSLADATGMRHSASRHSDVMHGVHDMHDSLRVGPHSEPYPRQRLTSTHLLFIESLRTPFVRSIILFTF